MTTAQFAKIAKVSKGTVLHWIRKGELPATQVRTKRGPGYEIEMDEAQALEWLKRSGKPIQFLNRRLRSRTKDLLQEVLENRLLFDLASDIYKQEIFLTDLEEYGLTAKIEFDLRIRAFASIEAARVFLNAFADSEEDE